MIERIAGMVAQVSAAIGADADRYADAESWAVIASVFDIAVKGLLIVAAAGVAAYLLRGASSAVRHFVWTLAAAALVALPVFALAMPRWQVAVPGLRRAERPVAEAAAVAEATVHEIHVARSRKVIVVPGRQTGSTVIVGVPDVVVIERPKAAHAPHAPVPPAWPVPPSWVRVEPLRPTRAPRAWSSPSDLARQVREEVRRAAEAAREEARRAVEAAREEAKRATDMARAAAFEAALEAELEAREAARAALERELGVRARLRLELEREDSAAALMIGAAAMPSAGGSFAASFPSPPRFPGGVSWTWLAIALWLGGVAVVMVRVAVGAARVRALGRRSWCIERGWPVPLLRRLCAELGIERRVKLLEGDAAAMPLTWGVLRPVVLLPASTAQWPAARLEAVLRHELAHVRRFDVLTQLIAEIACALHWFNPLVWLVAKRLRIEREMACDDDVIASGSPPADYAADLVELARSLRPAPATYAAIAMARPAHLKD
ncbi:MAG: M56 family metallopeptidase, partial [Longimicrobiales bacterium]